MKTDEGYIKFNCHWVKGEPVAESMLSEINRWRDNLYELGLIGAYDNGIGFGNISIRTNGKLFLITGSVTGGFPRLNPDHYVMVTEYDLMQNSLTCSGPIKASSESLSHAVIYDCSPETNAVIHIHNLELWEALIHKVPTTNVNVAYGTPQMANEIIRLFGETTVANEKILVMGGHQEGIISFGRTLDEAGKILINRFEEMRG